MDRELMQRGARRRVVAVLLALTLVGSWVVASVSTSAATVPRGRLHIELVKKCPKKSSNPSFLIRNRTARVQGADRTPAGGAEPINGLTIWVKGQQVGGPYNIPAGTTLEVTLPGVEWTGTFVAKFKAKWRNEGLVAMETHQVCRCEKPNGNPPPTTSTTSTTFFN